MQKKIVIGVLMISLLGVFGCNMSDTCKGALTGAAVGGAAGLGISAISGGSVGWGALAGAGMGALAGGVMGHNKNK